LVVNTGLPGFGVVLVFSESAGRYRGDRLFIQEIIALCICQEHEQPCRYYHYYFNSFHDRLIKM